MTDPLDRDVKEPPFVASVVSSGWGLFRTHVSISLLFAIPLIAIQFDIAWEKISIGKNGDQLGPGERSLISYVLLTLVGLTLVEMLLSKIRLAFDRTALVITDEGVQGYHAWIRRSFRWSEVSDVIRSGNQLWICKRAKSKFLQEWNRHCRPGGRYHWSKLLVVGLNDIDQSADTVLAEINRHWKPTPLDRNSAYRT